MNKLSNHERFAASVLAQSLARNGYRAQAMEHGPTDLVVTDRTGKPSFGVEVKWVSKALPLHHFRARKIPRSATPVYVAVVVGDGTEMLASPGLISRLRIKDPAVHIQPLEGAA